MQTTEEIQKETEELRKQLKDILLKKSEKELMIEIILRLSELNTNINSMSNMITRTYLIEKYGTKKH